MGRYSSDYNNIAMGDTNQRAGSGIAGDTLYTSMNPSGNRTGEGSQWGGIGFIYTLSEQVSEQLITIIQDYFQAYPLGQQYLAHLALANKEVVVTDEFVKDGVQLPQVVVQGMPADAFPLSFGNKLGYETYMDHKYQVYGGHAVFNATIAVYEGSMRSCKELVDILFLGFMYYIKIRLQTLFTWPEDSKLRFSNPTKMAPASGTATGVGSEMYVSRFSVNLRTEWKQFFEIVSPEMAGIKHTGSVEDSDHEVVIDTD